MVIFSEDIGALLGLVFALLAITLTMITGNPIYNALGSIVIGILLLVIAVLIGKEVKELIIGQGVEPTTKNAMLALLNNQESIDEVYNILHFAVRR